MKESQATAVTSQNPILFLPVLLAPEKYSLNQIMTLWRGCFCLFIYFFCFVYFRQTRFNFILNVEGCVIQGQVVYHVTLLLTVREYLHLKVKTRYLPFYLKIT